MFLVPLAWIRWQFSSVNAACRGAVLPQMAMGEGGAEARKALDFFTSQRLK
jgi:hypothetical protein